MPSPKITALRFRPPVAIARLGDSRSPLEAFTWAEDPRAFGAGQTVIVPRVSFEVLADGSLEPYVPGSIRFRDNGAIRPVCPFLELEADVDSGAGETRAEPLTSALLAQCQLSLAELTFKVAATNRKAERRTGDPSCRFEARVVTLATNHSSQVLNAWSQIQTNPPLVLRERRISLGFFQVIRPSSRASHVRGVCLDTIRVRFTPATGQVYGPPGADESQTTDSREPHLIVPLQNRILNPAASWIGYNYRAPKYPAPRPPDTYDGENDVKQVNASWGIVDDTCDVLISASLAVEPGTLTAAARVLVGPPHFAPDRRPFYSIADDLADRDPEAIRKSGLSDATPQERHDAIADLFRRISETAPIINLERIRYRQIQVNAEKNLAKEPDFPEVGDKSMTGEDKIEERNLLSLAGETAMSLDEAGEGANDAPAQPRSERAKTRHEQLAQPEVWMDFLTKNRARVRDVLRPPFARFSELASEPAPQHPFDFRDPRFKRSYGFDARMPPYMRDCDLAPLSLTRLQWDLLFPDGIGGSNAERVETPAEIYGEIKAYRHARQLKPRKTK